ncbi:MAG: tRNA (guanosine(46)-N7)-methyltransferase TrmB [Candidatus Eisenbacteria bacterium]
MSASADRAGPASCCGAGPEAGGRNPIEIDPGAWTPPFDWTRLFGTPGPVELEIGCGKGMFLKEAARAHPEIRYLGVERAGKFYRTAVCRLSRAGITSVRLMRADGLDVLARWIPPGSLETVHIYFPDPWPKKRHRKRRIFRPDLLELTSRALVPHGELRVATDDAAYACDIRALIAGDPRFRELPWPAEAADRHPTNYALKWTRAGRSLWWARYRT